MMPSDSASDIFRMWSCMSTAQTAQALGVSEDVVRTRFSRARSALQRDLLDRTDSAVATVFTFGQARCDRVVAPVLSRI